MGMSRRATWPGRMGVLALLLGMTAAAGAAEPSGSAYDKPEEAVTALIEAAAKNDDAALLDVFGAAAKDLLMSGSDPVVSKERQDLAAQAKARRALRTNEDGSKTLVVGEDDWPLPFPLVKGDDGKWHFDVAAGREELLARRIGRNEHRAIDLCRLYAEAQIEYAALDRDADGVREYAQRLRSSKGTQDGLYWPTAKGEAASPLGPLVASWREHLGAAKDGGRVPVGGYYFRVLRGQGTSAPGGLHSYVINGNMIAGFAIVAYPAKYGSTGVMSFMMSHHGGIFERDLGSDTAGSVHDMIGFNPTSRWRKLEEE